jgi:hypothetical protein
VSGATTITDVVDALAVVLATLEVNGVPITSYDHEPGPEGIQVPCSTIFLPDVERPDLQVGESVFGADDWDFTITLRLYHYLDAARTAQRQLEVLLADAILIVDSDPTLGGVVLDARVIKAVSNAVHTEDRPRPLMAYECELHARRLVDTLYLT